jgi:hypothetical protein
MAPPVQQQSGLQQLGEAFTDNPVVNIVKKGAKAVGQTIAKAAPAGGVSAPPVAAGAWREGGGGDGDAAGGADLGMEEPRNSYFQRELNAPQRTPAEIAAMAEGMFGAPQLASGGGYTAERAGVAKGFGEAEQMHQEAANRVLEAQAKFRQEAAPLAAQQAERLKLAEEAERGRVGRMKTLGEQQDTLSREMAGKVEGFKVDPSRLFGQGGERAMTQFTLSIANVLSNVGEAMQGKGATNAVMGLVRDRIAQDIALQENDYRRMLQGYEVRRNGLMDAVQMVGNERAGAEALAKQQALVYANQLDQLADRVGLTDAKLAYTFKDAAAKMKMQVAAHEQQAKQFDVNQVNEARRVGATIAAETSRANAQMINTQNTARAQWMASVNQLTDKDTERAQRMIDQASKDQKLPQLHGILQNLKRVYAIPGAADELGGFKQSYMESVGKEGDASAFARWKAEKVSGSMTPAQRNFLDLVTQFRALKSTSQGGKAITGIEDFLFNPFRGVQPQDMPAKFQRLEREIEFDRDTILKQAGFPAGSPASRYLAGRLNEMIPVVAQEATSFTPQPSAISGEK